MNDIQIHDLKTADKEILKEIFKINESYNPFLGPLKTLDNLIELIERSNYSIFLTMLCRLHYFVKPYTC